MLDPDISPLTFLELAFYLSASALDAVRCAIQMQKTLAQRNAATIPDRAIRIRIGVHLGDMVCSDAHVLGDGVNIAARIEPLAEPGGICISQQVFDQIRNKIEDPLVKLGTGELKNIQVPVVIYKVVLAEAPSPKPLFLRLSFYGRQKRIRSRLLWGVCLLLFVGLALDYGRRWLGSRPSLFSKPGAIAVLPFVNTSSDRENEFLCDGLTEEIINALAKAATLRVASRTSAFAFKGKHEDIQKIAEQLHVGALVEGSVRKAGNKLKITVELVNASDGFQIWSETYDRDLSDVLALQNEIAQQVIAALKEQLRTGDLWGGMTALRNQLAGRR